DGAENLCARSKGKSQGEHDHNGSNDLHESSQAWCNNKTPSPGARAPRAFPHGHMRHQRRIYRCRSKIDVEDGHREVVGEFALVLILVDQAQKFVSEIKLGGVVLARACLYLQAGIVEGPFEIGVQFFEFFGFQPASPDIDLSRFIAPGIFLCKPPTSTIPRGVAS